MPFTVLLLLPCTVLLLLLPCTVLLLLIVPLLLLIALPLLLLPSPVINIHWRTSTLYNVLLSTVLLSTVKSY